MGDQVRAAAEDNPSLRGNAAVNLGGVACQDHSRVENWSRDELINVLRQALEENRKIKEESEVTKAAHTRDVASLDHMLSHVMSENKRLTAALELHKGELHAMSKVIEGRSRNAMSGAKHSGLSSNSSALSTSIDTTIDSESTCSHEFDKQRITILSPQERAFSGVFGKR